MTVGTAVGEGITVGAAVAGADVAAEAVVGAAVAGAAVAGAVVGCAAGAPQAVKTMLTIMNTEINKGILLAIAFSLYFRLFQIWDDQSLGNSTWDKTPPFNQTDSSGQKPLRDLSWSSLESRGLMFYPRAAKSIRSHSF
jgi:hypothetical protein